MEACGVFHPVVFSAFGALGRRSRRGLAVTVGAECPEGCQCNGRRHGLEGQRKELQRVLRMLSFALARAHYELVLRAWLSARATSWGAPEQTSRLRRQARRALGALQRRGRRTGRTGQGASIFGM